MRVQIAGIILLVFSLVSAYSKEKVEYEPLSLAANKTFDVALSQFRNINLSATGSYLVFSIPLLIKEQVAEIKEHFFKAEELAALKKRLILQKLNSERKRLRDLQNDKDNILFNTILSGAQKRTDIINKDKEIRAVLDSIHYLKNEDTVNVNLPDFLPISLKTGTNLLYNSYVYSVLQFARTNKIDLLIYGTIEEIQDYISVEIRAFDSNLEKDVYIYKNTGETTDIYNHIDEGIAGLVNVILGREWASLVINTDFPETRIFVDNVLNGYGSVQLQYLKPGTKKIAAFYPGYEKEEQEITLAPFETKVLHIDLKEITLEKITIQSNPDAADLYLNTVWTGKTPLEIERNAGFTEILLIKPGFNNYQFHLAPDTLNPVMINLIPDTVKPEEIQKKKRNEFYLWFGLTLLSIPIPVFCEGFSADYARASDNYLFDYQERIAFSETSRILKYVQYGSAAVEITLIITSFFKLFDYLDASNKLTQ